MWSREGVIRLTGSRVAGRGQRGEEWRMELVIYRGEGENRTSVSGWAHEGRRVLRADAWISIRALRKAS